jgi:hypothetical protein
MAGIISEFESQMVDSTDLEIIASKINKDEVYADDKIRAKMRELMRACQYWLEKSF